MGAEAPRLFERSDAGGLIAVVPGERPGIDVGHPEHVVLRIKISIEHAASPAKLELEAGSFADLEGGVAEMADELLRGEADDSDRLARNRALNDGSFRLRLLARGAARENQSQRQGEGG